MINDGECGDDGWFFYFFLEVSILGVVTLWEELQGRHGQFLAGKAHTVAATSAVCCRCWRATAACAAFYSARQGLGLGGLASRGGSGFGGHKKQGTRMLC